CGVTEGRRQVDALGAAVAAGDRGQDGPQGVVVVGDHQELRKGQGRLLAGTGKAESFPVETRPTVEVRPEDAGPDRRLKEQCRETEKKEGESVKKRVRRSAPSTGS